MGKRVMHRLNLKTVKVRKQNNGKLHRCHYCLREIPPGTKVEASSWCDQGEAWTIYQCMPCGDIIDEYGKEIIDPCDRTYPEGCVDEFLKYCRWSFFGKKEMVIDKYLYWLKIKYFGYGDEKWD